MSNINITPASFEKVVQHCEQRFSKMQVENTYAVILGVLPASVEKISHFEISGKKELSVDFHIEKADKTLQILQASIKHWKGICVFDEKIRYSPWMNNYGRLYIKCNYSDGLEKIQAYINEFIYQIKSRIEILIK